MLKRVDLAAIVQSKEPTVEDRACRQVSAPPARVILVVDALDLDSPHPPLIELDMAVLLSNPHILDSNLDKGIGVESRCLACNRVQSVVRGQARRRQIVMKALANQPEVQSGWCGGSSI